MMNKKTTDIVAYLTWVGLLVAFVAGDRREARFHLNQSLVIWLAGTLAGVAERLLDWLPLVGWLVDLQWVWRWCCAWSAGSSASSTPSGAWRSRCPCWAESICCIENRRGEARRASPLAVHHFPGKYFSAKGTCSARNSRPRRYSRIPAPVGKSKRR